jgi:hypothetical protein
MSNMSGNPGSVSLRPARAGRAASRRSALDRWVRLNRSVFVVVLSLLAVLSCGKAPQMRGKLAGLQQIADQAERNGAVRCAPRELALAKSHLTFAETELQQGYMSKAEGHLAIAEPNANAALSLSPPEHCTSRDFVEPTGDRDGDGYLDRARRVNFLPSH